MYPYCERRTGERKRWSVKGNGTMTGDALAIILVQVFLLMLLVPAVCYDTRERVARKKLKSGFSATANRGDASMNALYVVYGLVVGAGGVMITEAEAFHGYKSAIMLIDYVILTYLFLFSSWFRNMVFFKMLQRAKKD